MRRKGSPLKLRFGDHNDPIRKLPDSRMDTDSIMDIGVWIETMDALVMNDGMRFSTTMEEITVWMAMAGVYL